MTTAPRVLFVAPSAYPLGGIQTWLDYLLPGLAARGLLATVGLTAGHWHDVSAYLRAHPGLEHLAVPNPTGSHEGRVRAVVRAIRTTKPDIVVSVNIPDSLAAVARLRARRGGAPRAVMAIHGIQPDIYEDARRYRGTLDGVICTNRLATRLAIAHGIDPARLYYAPYGVDVPAVGQLRNTAIARPLRLAYVGRLEQWQKRVADLPAILGALAARNVEFELAIAGAGPAEAALRQMLARHEASGQVRFLGNLSSRELVEQVYSWAEVLLLTSSWETGPIVVWEAMAHGLVVVSSCYVGIGLEDGLRDGSNCLLFTVGSADQAAGRIAQLEDPVLRHRLTDAGHALIRARYTRARSIEAWDRCFRSILEAPPLPVSDEPIRVSPAGRLDRLLGPAFGETLRRAVGVRFRHRGPGGEWPHSYGIRREDDVDFWRLAQEFDAVPPASARSHT